MYLFLLLYHLHRFSYILVYYLTPGLMLIRVYDYKNHLKFTIVMMFIHMRLYFRHITTYICILNNKQDRTSICHQIHIYLGITISELYINWDFINIVLKRSRNREKKIYAYALRQFYAYNLFWYPTMDKKRTIRK